MWPVGPHRYNCNISVCGTEVDNTRPSWSGFHNEYILGSSSFFMSENEVAEEWILESDVHERPTGGYLYCSKQRTSQEEGIITRWYCCWRMRRDHGYLKQDSVYGFLQSEVNSFQTVDASEVNPMDESDENSISREQSCYCWQQRKWSAAATSGRQGWKLNERK